MKETMEPVSKGVKFYGETGIGDHVDKISNLPPDLVGNILSFLPTKEAVATSVLSTKWKWFWTLISNLKFVECLHSNARGKDRTKLLKASFISFVYRVLFYRKQTPLNYFGLNCDQRYYASHIRAWVSAVLPFGVKNLELSIDLKDASPVIPSELFSCKSLVTLKLGWGFRIDVPAIVCLPILEVLTLSDVEFPDDYSLRRFLLGCPVLKKIECMFAPRTSFALPLEFFAFRKLAILSIYCFGFVMNPPALVSLPSLAVLHLSGVEFPDNESFRRLLRGCPLLKELNMRTYGTDATVLHIDAPTLSDLTLSFRSRNTPHGKLIIDTPSLRYLKVSALTAKSLEVTDLSQLVEAEISGVLSQVISNLIPALSKVRTLRLCPDIIQVITEHGCKLPKFQNMTTLKLGASSRVGWALLPDLLENSPVLETLVFETGPKSPFSAMDQPSPWSAPEKVPHCLIHHLRVIEVSYYEGDIEEEEIIEYFMANGGVVNDLTIQYSRGFGDIRDVILS